jgi:hypothetical protein
MGPGPESIERSLHRAETRKGATPSNEIIKKFDVKSSKVAGNALSPGELEEPRVDQRSRLRVNVPECLRLIQFPKGSIHSRPLRLDAAYNDLSSRAK